MVTYLAREDENVWLLSAGNVALSSLNPSKAVEGRSAGPRVLLVSRNLRTREVAARTLQESGRFSMTVTAASIDEAARVAAGFLPHVVLLEVPADAPAIRAALRAVLESAPSAKIVIWAPEQVGERGLDVLRAGAAGFVAPGLDRNALVRTLSGVAAGEPAVSRRFGTWLIARIRAKPERRTGMRPVKSALTTREWEVLDLISAGVSKAAIARDLRVTVGTVSSHLRSLSRKLSTSRRERSVARGSARRRAPATD